jgi:hypothetical protein
MREVVHTFVKPCMECDFDAKGFHIIPQEVLGCVWEKTKKDTFARIMAEFGTARPRRAYPNTASKGT